MARSPGPLRSGHLVTRTRYWRRLAAWLSSGEGTMAPIKTPRCPTGPMQPELRLRWEVQFAATHFQRVFNQSLYPFVGHVVQVFEPPASPASCFSSATACARNSRSCWISGLSRPETLNEAIRAVVPGASPSSPTIRGSITAMPGGVRPRPGPRSARASAKREPVRAFTSRSTRPSATCMSTGTASWSTTTATPIGI